MSLCGDAPAPDPAIGEAARASAEVARESLDFYKTVYAEDIKPRLARDEALRNEVIQQQLASSRQQDAFAQEQNQYYRDTFQPVERKMVEEAMGYDSADNINQRMGIAAANTNRAFSGARDQQNRAISAMGLRPDSGAFARANRLLTAQQAATSAAGQTQAAFDTMDKGIALRAGAANFGRNMPNTASQYYTASGAAGANAANISSQGISNVAAGAGVMGQGYNTALQGNQSAGNLYLGQYNAQMQGYNAQNAAMGDLFGAIGTFAGMKFGADGGQPHEMADGPPKGVKSKRDMGKRKKRGVKVHEGKGVVRGPGGPIDDKVPARLSRDEYVLPADTVKRIGKQNLDRIVAQTHTPAEQQARGLKRRA